MHRHDIVLASDLDNTLVYSPRRTIIGEKICVEVYKNEPNSYMCKKSIELLKIISSSIDFVPLTTRSKIGFSRIDFSVIGIPKYALVCNGGMLLVDGEVNDIWYNKSLEMIKSVDFTLEQAIHILENDVNRTLDVRKVENLFVFTKSSDVKKSVNALFQHINSSLVDITTHKDKIYVIPKVLSKGVAIDRLRNYMDTQKIISAGDTIFDVPMLERADVGYYPEEILNDCKHIENATCVYKSTGNFSDVFLSDILKNHLKT